MTFRLNSEGDQADRAGQEPPLNRHSTIGNLRESGVRIVTEPFVLPAISRRLAFFADPFGNLVELAEVLS